MARFTGILREPERTHGALSLNELHFHRSPSDFTAESVNLGDLKEAVGPRISVSKGNTQADYRLQVSENYSYKYYF